MANGDMLTELQSILRGETTIPDRVANRMLLAGMVEINQRLITMQEYVKMIDRRVADIETKRAVEQKDREDKTREQMVRDDEKRKLEDREKANFFTWKDLAKEVALPIALVIISVIISLTLSKGP